jgi:hypothetical protein
MGAVSQARVAEAVLTVLCPTICCVALGAIAQGSRVLAPRSGFFQLGVNALVVGVLVLIARRWPTKRFLAAGAMITVAATAVSSQAGPRIMLHTAVLMVMWVGVVFLNVKVLSRRGWIGTVGQYIAWSLVFAIGLFGAGGILMVLFRPAQMMAHLVFYAKLAALTGLGLGIGFAAQDRLGAGLRCKTI